MYIARMKTIVSEIFSNNWYQERARAIQDIIDAYVLADPNKFYSYNDFRNNITRSVGTGPLAIVGLTELMNARIAFLASRPEFQAPAPVISNISHLPASPAPHSNVQFSAQVEDADSVFLGFRQNPAYQFEKIVMYDDGEHGDGAPNDGLYATTVRIGASEINYYIYAENTQAVAFSPPRAEKEFFRLPVVGRVVINELLAINNTTAPDPRGQYDDWIEFYNNTSSPISLDGFLLTDDSTNLTKWQFPDITMPAQGYLIVWADNDLNQPGLHANFELAGSGGTLILSDDDGEEIDRVVFGPQTADISFGRYPNGSGSFIFMNPTFGYENVSGVGIAENEGTKSPRLFQGAFPNPFSRSTLIRYNLPIHSNVSLRLYDVTGRLIKKVINRMQNSGNYSINFTPEEPAQGVYLARLEVKTNNGNAFAECMKIILVK